MLQSWNKMCFKGEIIKSGLPDFISTGFVLICDTANLSLPGRGDVAGFWPGFWTMGNLGRPGYLATTEGMWPCTYHDECYSGIMANRSSPDGISFLPGMKLPACIILSPARIIWALGNLDLPLKLMLSKPALELSTSRARLLLARPLSLFRSHPSIWGSNRTTTMLMSIALTLPPWMHIVVGSSRKLFLVFLFWITIGTMRSSIKLMGLSMSWAARGRLNGILEIWRHGGWMPLPLGPTAISGSGRSQMNLWLSLLTWEWDLRSHTLTFPRLWKLLSAKMKVDWYVISDCVTDF